MSTNSNCDVIEVNRGTWYYLLEDSNAPKNAWDWREHARAYGPFKGIPETLAHLGENHPNPGGYSVRGLPVGAPDLDLAKSPVLRTLIENAIAPTPKRGLSGYGRSR